MQPVLSGRTTAHRYYWPFQTISFSRELGATDLLHLAIFPVLFPVVAVTHRAHTNHSKRERWIRRRARQWQVA